MFDFVLWVLNIWFSDSGFNGFIVK
jgi:hypothetical protein